ncbi:hypothetical protein SMICM304S_03387 [Streptomyces microflavus]
MIALVAPGEEVIAFEPVADSRRLDREAARRARPVTPRAPSFRPRTSTNCAP